MDRAGECFGDDHFQQQKQGGRTHLRWNAGGTTDNWQQGKVAKEEIVWQRDTDQRLRHRRSVMAERGRSGRQVKEGEGKNSREAHEQITVETIALASEKWI